MVIFNLVIKFIIPNVFWFILEILYKIQSTLTVIYIYYKNVKDPLLYFENKYYFLTKFSSANNKIYLLLLLYIYKILSKL